MKLNHAIKKIAAVGAGAMLLGLSAAAVTANLEDYPAPFIKDGMFSGSIVVGEAAATVDVLGAIDIATSLQAASLSQKEVALPGQSEQTVLDDGVQLRSGSDELYYGVNLNSAKARITADDADWLEDVSFEDEDGTTYDAEFKVTPPAASVSWASDDKILGNDDPGFFVDFAGATWDFSMIFPEAIDLDAFRGESIDILGQEYTFAQATDETNQTAKIVTLYKSGVKTTIEAGAPQTIQLGDESFEVNVIGANTDQGSATICVNGDCKTVNEGDFVNVGKVKLFIDDVFIVNIPTEVASVRVFVGAQKIILEDGEKVKVEVSGKNENVDGTLVAFTGSTTTSQIQITYTPEDHDSDFSPLVNSKSSGLPLGEEYVDPVFNQIKWAFTDRVPGPMGAANEMFMLEPKSDNEFGIVVNNYNGAEYDLTLFVPEDNNANLAYDNGAQEKYVLAANLDADEVGGASHTKLMEDNRFILRSSTNSEYTRFMQVTSIDNSSGDEQIDLEDLATGDTKTHTASETFSETTYGQIDGDNTTTVSYPYGEFSYDGFEYGFVVISNTEIVLVSASSPGTAYNPSNLFITENGGQLTIPTQALGLAANSTIFRFDEETDFNNADPGTGESGYFNVTVTYDSTDSDNQVTVTSVSYDQTWSDMVEYQDTNQDVYGGTSIYGTYVEWDKDSNAGDVTFYYPTEQAFYNVYVAPVSAQVTMSGGEGAITTDEINPINVGAAILDTQVGSDLGKENLIVVGGPCVNTVAASLMGNPDPCYQGFQQGEGIIKLFKNTGGTASLLVAGYSAQDTRLASQVVASYDRHQGKLVGTEVVVSGVSISDVKISAPAMNSGSSAMEDNGSMQG